VRKYGRKTIRARRGFVFVELLIVVVLLGLLMAIAGPVAGKWIRRSEDLAACAAARQVLAVARLEAVKRTANVVVEISLTADRRIRLRAFQDRANDSTAPLPPDEAAAAGNCVQDTGSFATSPATDEPTLVDVSLSSRIHLWKRSGSKDDIADAVHFDTYTGNASLKDRIVFVPTGAIAPPEDSASGVATASGGRGIYFADWQGKNYFRVTVESDLSGKGRVDKYVEGSGYVAAGWSWL
jgi:prepilin-type N-terminal cleavage/methylation domain-containing protein